MSKLKRIPQGKRVEKAHTTEATIVQINELIAAYGVEVYVICPKTITAFYWAPRASQPAMDRSTDEEG